MTTKKIKKVTKEVKPAKVKVEKGTRFKLEIEVNGELFKSVAKNLELALKDVLSNDLFPKFIKSKVVVRFGTGKEKAMQVYFPRQAGILFRRLDVHPQEIGLLAERLKRNLE